MKKIFTIGIMVLVATLCTMEHASAQSVKQMQNSLSSRTEDGAYVKVSEGATVTEAVQAIEKRRGANGKVSGQRVVIFSDNAQYAEDNANKVLETFQKHYPHINAYKQYEAPYFKVMVGDCITDEEVHALIKTLEGEYPNLFPTNVQIPLSDLGNVRADTRETPDSLHKYDVVLTEE
jgi:hypothetical protein